MLAVFFDAIDACFVMQAQLISAAWCTRESPWVRPFALFVAMTLAAYAAQAAGPSSSSSVLQHLRLQPDVSLRLAALAIGMTTSELAKLSFA